jgi:hypothetical protein
LGCRFISRYKIFQRTRVRRRSRKRILTKLKSQKSVFPVQSYLGPNDATLNGLFKYTFCILYFVIMNSFFCNSVKTVFKYIKNRQR